MNETLQTSNITAIPEEERNIILDGFKGGEYKVELISNETGEVIQEVKTHNALLPMSAKRLEDMQKVSRWTGQSNVRIMPEGIPTHVMLYDNPTAIDETSLNMAEDIGELIGYWTLNNDFADGSHTQRGNRVVTSSSREFITPYKFKDTYVGEFGTLQANGTINKIRLLAENSTTPYRRNAQSYYNEVPERLIHHGVPGTTGGAVVAEVCAELLKKDGTYPPMGYYSSTTSTTDRMRAIIWAQQSHPEVYAQPEDANNNNNAWNLNIYTTTRNLQLQHIWRSQFVDSVVGTPNPGHFRTVQIQPGEFSSHYKCDGLCFHENKDLVRTMFNADGTEMSVYKLSYVDGYRGLETDEDLEDTQWKLVATYNGPEIAEYTTASGATATACMTYLGSDEWMLGHYRNASGFNCGYLRFTCDTKLDSTTITGVTKRWMSLDESHISYDDGTSMGFMLTGVRPVPEQDSIMFLQSAYGTTSSASLRAADRLGSSAFLVRDKDLLKNEDFMVLWKRKSSQGSSSESTQYTAVSVAKAYPYAYRGNVSSEIYRESHYLINSTNTGSNSATDPTLSANGYNCNKNTLIPWKDANCMISTSVSTSAANPATIAYRSYSTAGCRILTEAAIPEVVKTSDATLRVTYTLTYDATPGV